MTIVLDSLADFTLEAAKAVAWNGRGVSLGPTALEAMRAARARFEALIENPEVVIYGVTSGYGQQAKIRLSPEERKVHAARLPKAPAASWGDPLPDRVARGIVFARLANFVEGHAAVSPDLAVAVARMLEDAEQPVVPARGQGGAGEILSLSHLFLPVLAKVTPAEKDALSLINGSPAATGLVTDAALAARSRLELACQVLALTFEAFNAPLTHLDPGLDALWNNPHDGWALGRLRALLDAGHGGARRPYQAPVSFRILPRILGQAHLATETAEAVAAQSLMAVTDNPVVLPPDAGNPHGRAISTGGYHNAQAPMAMDQITAAYANLAVIAERMCGKMLDAAISLLPDEVYSGPPDGRGYLGCLPMAAAGYAEEARGLATATLLPGSETGGFGANDVASPVFLGWSKQDRAGMLLEHTLASLAPIALRAFDVTERPIPGPLVELAEQTRARVPDLADADTLGPSVGRLAAFFHATVFGGA
ncbi:MAG: aromatic amino acid lyase [Pseudomonadota bacterium]